MTTEDYVSHGLAKLLKEKGFDIPYDSFRGVYINGVFKRLNPGAAYGVNDGDEIVNVCSLQLAIKWLREKHNLAITTFATMDGWRCGVSRIKFDSEGFIVDIIDGIDGGNIPNCGTYEEACEEAIRYCLENLI